MPGLMGVGFWGRIPRPFPTDGGLIPPPGTNLSTGGEPVVAQNSTKSGLTGKRRKAAEMLANPDFRGTITELCNTIGVPRRTLYNWLGDDGFRAEVDGLIERYTDSELSRVWKSLMRLIDKGNLNAIKLYFELKGKYKPGIGKNTEPAENFVGQFIQATRPTPEDLEALYAEETD